jgi:hypothetical protein
LIVARDDGDLAESHLVRGVIYPVPDPASGSLGALDTTGQAIVAAVEATVVVPTRDRVASLRRTLLALAAQRTPSGVGAGRGRRRQQPSRG